MNNILNHFKPLKKDSSSYESITSKYSLSKDLDLLWYHSAGDDFSILDYFNLRQTRSSLFRKPDLYVFTDYDFGDSKILRNKIRNDSILFQNSKTKITKENSAELKFEGIINDYFHKDFLRANFYRKNDYPVYLLDLKVETTGQKSYNVPLLYFIWENTAFLKAFVLERGIKIKYFQKPREYGFGGSWTEMVFLLCFLGIMNTKYLFLENQKLILSEFENALKIIKKDTLLLKKFMEGNNYIPEVKQRDIVIHTRRYDEPETYSVLLLSETGITKHATLTPEEKFNTIIRMLRI